MAKASAVAAVAPSSGGTDFGASAVVAAPPGAQPEDWSRFEEEADIKDEAVASETTEGEAPAPPQETTEVTETPGDDTPAEAQEAVEEEVSEPEPAEPAFDDALLADAKRLGYEADEAKSFGTPEALRKALIAEDRRLIRLAASRSQQAASQQTQSPSGNVTQQTNAAQQTPAQITDMLVELGLKPEMVGEEIVGAFQKFGELSDRRLQRVQAELQGRYDQVLNQMSEVLVAQQLDSAIASLGDSYKDQLGDAPTLELDPESDAYKNRVKLGMAANSLMQTYAGMGERVGYRNAIRKAALAVFPEKVKTIVRDEVEKAVTKRQQVQTTPPTSRKGAPVRQTIEEGLAEIAQKWSKKHNVPLGGDDSFD